MPVVNPISLPALPKLPPLEIPNTNDEGLGPYFFDSFSTVFSTQKRVARSQPSPTLNPPPSLRKSISADSFAAPSPSSTARPQQDAQPPVQKGFVAGLASAFKRDSSSGVRANRKRGMSIGSSRDPPNASSDRDQRFRFTSLKGPEQPRLTVRGGELPLPARSSASSIDPNQNLASASVPPPSSDSMNHASQNSQPKQPASKHDNIASASPNRSRSTSIGAQAQPFGGRLRTHTQLPNQGPVQQMPMDDPVTLVVIGTPGCGKTHAIRKGLSGFQLSNAQPSSAQRLIGNNMVPAYTYRSGRIPREKASEFSLSVIEIDVLPTDAPIPRDYIWPESIPRIDAVIICYDCADHTSFKPVENLFQQYYGMRLPMIVLACKADLKPEVEPETAAKLLYPYAGLIEVNLREEDGKDKIKRAFDWVLKAVFRHRNAIDSINQTDSGTYHNPASPDVLVSPPPWENLKPTISTISQSNTNRVTSMSPPSTEFPRDFHAQDHNGHRSAAFPVATTTNVQPIEDRTWENNITMLHSAGEAVLNDLDDRHPPYSGNEFDPHGPYDPPSQNFEQPQDKPKPAQFATLEELLEKLLFIAISGDDPSFISSFLLTYRRFCTPRAVLLAMQKKMRQLDDSCGDPMFSSFGQMRICHLLEVWIAEYPTDFAVKGTAGALHALIRSIVSKTHLLHYGSQVLPFLEILPTLRDEDAKWALEGDLADESDHESLYDDDEIRPSEMDAQPDSPDSDPPQQSLPTASTNSRDRKPSLPLVKSFGFGATDRSEPSTKQQLKELLNIANEVMSIESSEIAEEITRVEAKYFLDIESRHWMHFIFLKSRQITDPIVAFNMIANHIGDWVISLILCHDRPKLRARQMEKMVDIAARLRSLNNYSALRAFVAGINNATFPGDETMELFKQNSPQQAKNLQSWDVLLQSFRAHRAYRLALRNSRGACIPAMEVHIADMLKAQEANPDRKEDNTSKLHWAKFSMMGKFAAVTKQCQNQCLNSSDYNFPERDNIRDLFVRRPVMNQEMQRTRLNDTEFSDYGLLPPSNMPKTNMEAMRRLFFW